MLFLSIYCRTPDGDSYKKIVDSVKAINTEEAILNQKIAEFNKKPAPSFFSFNQKKEYQKEHSDLMKWRSDFLGRKEVADKEYRELQQDMNRPEVSKQIYKLRDEILKGDLAKREELNAIYADYKEMRDNIKSLAEVKKILGYEKTDRVINIPESSRTLKPVDLLKSVAADLSKSQNQGLQVRINSSEYER